MNPLHNNTPKPPQLQRGVTFRTGNPHGHKLLQHLHSGEPANSTEALRTTVSAQKWDLRDAAIKNPLVKRTTKIRAANQIAKVPTEQK